MMISLPKKIPRKTGPFCGVVAVAALAQVDFQKAREAFLPKHGNWKGRTTLEEVKLALARLGYSIFDLPMIEERPRLIDWALCVPVNNGPFLVELPDHWAVIEYGLSKSANGKSGTYGWWIVDQYGFKPLTKSEQRGRPVRNVYKLKELR